MNFNLGRFGNIEDLIHQLYLDSSEIWTSSNPTQIVLSGGETPKPFYEYICKMATDLRHLTIIPADERWVSLDDENSNEKMMRDLLGNGHNSGFNLLSLKTAHCSAYSAEDFLNRTYQTLGPSDLTLLGMGNDGHIASLFSCSPEYKVGIDPRNPKKFVAIGPKKSLFKRMSLTMAYLLKSKKVFFLLRGKEKLETLDRCLNRTDIENSAISILVNDYERPVEIYWCP